MRFEHFKDFKILGKDCDDIVFSVTAVYSKFNFMKLKREIAHQKTILVSCYDSHVNKPVCRKYQNLRYTNEQDVFLNKRYKFDRMLIKFIWDGILLTQLRKEGN